MRKRSVAIVDDHPFTRLGVRAALAQAREFEIVAEAGDGLEAWLIVQRLKPDVVVMDIDMPKLDGYELIKRIHRLDKPIKTLVLSMYTGQLPVQRAIRAGASGFVYKSHDTMQVYLGCVAILDGYRYFPGEAGLPECTPRDLPALLALTDREMSVARQLVAGLGNREIGQRLFISDKTVSAHKQNIFRKLRIGNLIELADYVRHADSYGLCGTGLA
ncbi:MAG: response regulator [Janthinobacterium lividum]